VKWTVLRGARKLDVTARAAARPESREVPLDALLSRLEDLRASGEFENLSEDLERVAREVTRERVRVYEGLTSAKRLRYAGTVGGSEVEVRGLGNVVVDDGGEEIVITTRDATIRIKPAAVQPPTPAPDRKPKREK
jgi:hypothetical protein